MSSPVLLCIDDRSETLELRRSILEPLGYCVLTASNSSTALAILEQRSVTAVLMHYKGEGMDAEAVAYHVKQKFPHQPIILTLSYCDVPERTLWLVDEYLMKSEYPEGLAQALERVKQLPQKVPPQSAKMVNRRRTMPADLTA